MGYSVILSYLIQNLNREATLPVGLFRGKAGIALALYVLNESHSNVNIEKVADALLDDVCSALNDLTDCSFAEGAAGIGFTVSYLHVHHMLDGDINEILFDVDAAIYREVHDGSISKDFTLVNGYIGYLFYAISRLESCPRDCEDVHKTILKHLAMTILDKIILSSSKIFSRLTNDVHTTILWEPPIIMYLLSKCIDLGVYAQKIPKVIGQWMVYFDGYLPHYQVNRLSWCVSLIYMNKRIHSHQLEGVIGNLLKIIDLESLKYEYDPRCTNVNEGWLYYAVVVCGAISQVDMKSPYSGLLRNVRFDILSANEHSLRNMKKNDEEMLPLGLIDGLGGVLLALTYLNMNN